jgi:pimeloyl-ACP methyl ester carboxylesterase
MRARGADDAAITNRVRGRARTAAGARVVAGLWRSFAEPSYDLRSASIAVPTLLVWGRRDVVLPMSAARQAQAALAGAELRTFDTGHVVFASDPDGFAAAVAPFVAAVRV